MTALGVGSFILLIRILDKSDFGTWILFLTITALTELGKDGFIRNGLIKFLADSPKSEHAKIITAGFGLNVILSLAIIILILLFSNSLSSIWNSPRIATMFQLYIISTVFLVPYSHFIYIQQGNFKFKGTLLTTLTRKGIFFGGVIALFYLDLPNENHLFYLVLLDAFCIALGTITSYFHVKEFQFKPNKPDIQWFKKLFHYGKFVFGTGIGANLIKMIDQWMLGSILSTATVSIYTAALRINNFVDMPTTAISTIIFPVSAKRNKTEGTSSTKFLYEKSVAAILCITLPAILFVVIFADYIILIIAGKDYVESIDLLRITIFYTVFTPFGRQFGTLLDSIGKPQLTFTTLMIVTLSNVIFNYIFITHYGILGAVYGTFTAKVVGFIVSMVILKRTINVSIFNIFVYLLDFYKATGTQITRLLKRGNSR